MSIPQPVKRSEIKKSTVLIAAQTMLGLGHGSGVVTTLRDFLGYDKPYKAKITRLTSRGERTSTIRLSPDHPIVVTCAHCVSEAVAITVRFHDGEQSPAHTICIDNGADVAVLYIEEDKTGSYTLATMGDSDSCEDGDDIFAVGNPLGPGQEFSISRGIVSSERRFIPLSYLPAFQVDAEINPGNSGGILTNRDGHWIGVNFAGVMIGANTGINYSLHINEVHRVVKHMLDRNHVTRHALAMRITALTPFTMTVLDRPTAHGALVEYVKPGSDASTYFKQMDVVLQVNGDRINVPAEFEYAMQKAAGKTVAVTVVRGKKEVTFNVQVPTRTIPFAHIGGSDHYGLGLTLQPSVLEDGLLITYVHKYSVSAQVGLKRGMIITGIQDPNDDMSDGLKILRGLTPEEFFANVQNFKGEPFMVEIMVPGMGVHIVGLQAPVQAAGGMPMNTRYVKII